MRVQRVRRARDVSYLLAVVFAAGLTTFLLRFPYGRESTAAGAAILFLAVTVALLFAAIMCLGAALVFGDRFRRLVANGHR